MTDNSQLSFMAPLRLDNTLDLLHNLFQEALSRSNDILAIVDNYYHLLQEQHVAPEDQKLFDDFVDGVHGCLQYRKKTFGITNIVTYINITLLYIIYWLNQNGSNIDVFLVSRRKALESDLFKILKKSLKNDYLLQTGQHSSTELSANIRDRFGFLFVVLNNCDSLPCIYEIYNSAVLGILCGKSRKLKNDFIDWLKNHPRIPTIEKDMIISVLGIPFALEHVKDFIANPKTNGYQTLQCTLRIEMYSELLPGCMVEVQIRDWDMHINAVTGSASHQDYKEEFDGPEFHGLNLQKLADVFTIDNFDDLKIPGFTRYDHRTLSTDNDLNEVANPGDWDGILYPKIFFDRHISPSLVIL